MSGHGSDAGYQRHRKAGEPACAACLQAHSHSQLSYARARHRAEARLKTEFADRYRELLDAELAGQRAMTMPP